MLTRGKLAEDDIRLVALALIAEAPRHGYEIIRWIEEKTAEWHSPSPNVIHPMLNRLAESGYVIASTEPPRLYTIAEEGRVYFEQYRKAADSVMSRLTALGERIVRWQEARGNNKRKDPDEGSESLVEILARVDSHRK